MGSWTLTVPSDGIEAELLALSQAAGPLGSMGGSLLVVPESAPSVGASDTARWDQRVPPEIRRASLESLTLTLKQIAGDACDSRTFPWIEPPPNDALEAAVWNLREHGALRRVLLPRAGPRATASARRAPFLEDGLDFLSRARAFLSVALCRPMKRPHGSSNN